MRQRHTWDSIWLFGIDEHLCINAFSWLFRHHKAGPGLDWPTARRRNSHKKKQHIYEGMLRKRMCLFCYGKVPLLHMTFWDIYISFELKNRTIVKPLGFLFFLQLPFFVFLFLYGDVAPQLANNAAQWSVVGLPALWHAWCDGKPSHRS